MTAASAALALVILGAIASVIYIQLRHAGLVALVIAGPLVSAAAVWLAPFPAGPVENGANALVFGVVTAQLIAAGIVRRVCNGEPPRKAASISCGEIARSVGPILAAVLIASIAFTVDRGMRVNCAGAGIAMLGGFGAALGVGGLAGLLPYSEDFIARANRLHERRAGMLQFVSTVTETRWSLSVTGIAMVFATLAGFGARGMHLQYGVTAPPWVFYIPLLVALIFAGLAFAVRDWRLAMGMTLTLALIAALAVWALASAWRPLNAMTGLWFSMVLSMVAAPLAVFAAHVYRAMRDGDGLAAALLRTLGDNGPAVIFASTASIILWLPLVLFGILWPAIMSIASLFSLIVFPALATTIYALFPRYRGVDEVFGRR